MILTKHDIDQDDFNEWLRHDHRIPAGMSHLELYLQEKKKDKGFQKQLEEFFK
jgi:hypothetical protein